MVVGRLFGGRAGAYLNNRLSEGTVMATLMPVYFLVGVVVVVRTRGGALTAAPVPGRPASRVGVRRSERATRSRGVAAVAASSSR